MTLLAVGRRCIARAPHCRAAVRFLSGAHPDVYDPKADMNYEPPTRDVVRMPRFADFRSDTVTKPTAEMTIAMIDAQVGDDVYGEDPTVNKLQTMAANLLEKEAALYVPSGTMGNLIAVAAQCNRGEEVILGDQQHIFYYEQCGVSQLFGIPLRTIPNRPDGTFFVQTPTNLGSANQPSSPSSAAAGGGGGSFPPTSLVAAIESRGGGVDPHYVKPALVSLENTHNRCGGAVLPLSFINDVADVCDEHGLKLHMDGARLMNAVSASKTTAAAIVKRCHSVSLCLSKGLGAPVGSVIAGDKAFIDRCRRLRKVLGGGMRQAGVIAAPAIVALKEGPKLLQTDHARAKMLARGLASIPGVVIDPRAVQTNIVYFALDSTVLNVAAFTRKQPSVELVKPGMRLSEAFAAGMEALGQVKLGAYGDNRLRAVTHHQIRDEDVEKFLDTAQQVAAALKAE